MSKIVFRPITINRVLQINPHVDGGWFWSKYSAQPYLGCSYGCTYCFLRANRYGLSKKNKKVDDSFSQIIRYKVNGPEILDRELSSVPRDIITLGDYQPAEAKFKLSRKMLEVCLKHRFPVLVIVKSLLVLRDMDLLTELSKKAWVGVIFSIASAKSGVYRSIFEPVSSTIESRFEALNKLSQTGIYTGVSLMPVMPGVNDSYENLECIVKRTVECGGQFVIGGGLTLLEGQKQKFFESVRQYNPGLISKYRHLYSYSFSPLDNSWRKIGMTIKQICLNLGINYRMKRFIPDSPLKINKQLAEKLFLKVYEMELDGTTEKTVWQWRRVAWRIDEFKIPIDMKSLQLIRSIDNTIKLFVGTELKNLSLQSN